MKKSSLIFIITLIIIAGSVFYVYRIQKLIKQDVIDSPLEKYQQEASGKDPRNTSYDVNKNEVDFFNSIAKEEMAPGSEERTITRIWDQSNYADLDRDEIKDAAVIISRDTVDEKTYFFVAASLQQKESEKYHGSNAVYLGVDLALQNISIEDGVIIVNYAERPSASSTDNTSIGVSRYFMFLENELREIQLYRQRDNGNPVLKLFDPRPSERIASPLTLRGEARGNWFFEASFPIFIVNWDGLIIGQGIATAGSDWMTEDFVPFTATIEFSKPEYKDNGALILKKDNPSGLPQNDDAFEFWILFK